MNETHKLNRYDILFIVLAIVFCTLVVVSNVIAIKLFRVPFFEDYALPAGLITYPLSFIVSDLITEIFGEKKAKLVVCLGLAMNLLTLTIIHCTILLPIYDQTNHEIFTHAFEISTAAVLGSMTAYIVAQLADIKIFGWVKTRTHDKHLWLRNNASTLISQFIDSVIVDTIIFSFGFGYPIEYVSKIIFISYAYKAFFSVGNTPLFYLAVYCAKYYLNSQPSSSIQLKQSKVMI